MTNKTISITCDSDNVVALNAFSKALAEMAQGNPVVGELKYKVSMDTTEATTSLQSLSGDIEKLIAENRDELYLTDTTAQQVESLAPEQYPVDQWVEMVHPDHNTTRMARSDAELEWMSGNGWVNPSFDEYESTDCQLLADTATLDSEGLPWDARIHSTNKATVADGTWRLRRKPKDMDEEQWQAEIKTVRNELEQLMAIELGEVVKDDTPEPAAVFAPSVEKQEWENNVTHPNNGDVCSVCLKPQFVSPGGITCENGHGGAPAYVPRTPPVPVPPPVETVTVEPPVIVPPPPVANVEPMTFPKLMTFLTERTGRITLEQVNELVAKHGLTRIDQLSQRPELIAAFVADVKTLLGE